VIVLAPLAIVLEKLSGLVHFSKEVLIIVIKLTQGRDHKSGGSIRVESFLKKEIKTMMFSTKKVFFKKKSSSWGSGFTRDNRVMVRLGFLTRPSRVTRSIFSSVQINPSPGSARSQIWTFRKSSYLQVCSNLDIILFPWWYHKRSYSLDVTVEENPGFANQLKSPEN